MRIRELEEGALGACDTVEVEAMSTKRVLVAVGGRILFYPTLLYNVLRNQIEAEFRWWDEVDQYLLLGAVPFPKDVLHFQQLGVKAVVTLNEPYETLVPSSFYKAHGIDHLVIPTRDYLFAPSLVDISRAVDFIHRNASGGRITYVHCKAGRGRSTTVVLCYLIKYKNMTPVDALEYVRSRRPRVLLAPSQWQAVQDYGKRISESPALQDCAQKSLPALDAILTACDSSEDCFRDQMLLLHQSEKVTPAVSSPADSRLFGDAVLITEDDLEGYESISENDLEEYEIMSNKVSDDQSSTFYGKDGARPMASKLSCLFPSFKISGNSAPASNSPRAVRAW